MKLSDYRKLTWPALLVCIALVFSLNGVVQFAQTTVQTGERTGYINDFAGVIDDTTRTKLSAILENVKQKSGIDFAVVTVRSTEGRDISDFLRRLSRDWNVGARNSEKSLLLVLAVDEKDSLAQFSRSAQLSLPEGILAEMHQRMRPSISAGNFSQGLDSGIQTFVASLAGHMALNATDFESVPVAAVVTPSATPEPTAAPTPDSSDPATREIIARATRPRTRTVSGSTAVREPAPARRVPTTESTVDDAADAEKVEVTLSRPLEERITQLNAFLTSHPTSKSRTRATEILVSAHAALGDEKLKRGESGEGVAQFMQAISLAPVSASDKLYTGVISQIPFNLYIRGEREAAAKAAQEIEAKYSTDAKRLLGVAAFYIGTEQGAEAARIAKRAIALAPDSAEAHQALGLALHISLRLDDAVAEYKRTLDLNPNSKGARRALADLHRAFGRADEAAALYREHLAAEPADKSARAGLVLALLDLGKTDEAKTELDSALAADPRNLPLLSGVAYWYAAHNDPDKAIEFGNRAFDVEPRYTWLQIALSRGLLAQRNPMEAERRIRFAQQHGRFSTLDYELASTLVASGLFDEAADVLARTFTIKDGKIETRLAGHVPASATTFAELLAPERRASIFQSVAADTEANAKIVRSLLVFTTLMNPDLNRGRIDEDAAIAAAKQFAAGDDAARVYRQLYAASRLLQRGIGDRTAFNLAESARDSANDGLTVPALTVAVQADEYREIRANAIAQGGTPDIPEAPRNVLANLLRGRIEDISGWARLNEDKIDEAVDHLQRAVNILPEGTPSWRATLWRLGSALERQDKKEAALANYIRSYNAGPPDPTRRSVIERLYRAVNGSLDGLEERLGVAAVPAPTTETTATAQPTPMETPADTAAATTPPAEPTPSPVSVDPGPTNQPSPAPAVTPTPDSTPVPTPTPEAPVSSPRLSESPVETLNKPRPTVVMIRGRVLDNTNAPLANVVVVLISPQGSVLAATTDANGNYEFTVAPSSSSYRLIPSKDGFTFEPVDKVVAKANEDQKDLNFVAVPVKP